MTQHAPKSASLKSTEARQHVEELNLSYLLELEQWKLQLPAKQSMGVWHSTILQFEGQILLLQMSVGRDHPNSAIDCGQLRVTVKDTTPLYSVSVFMWRPYVRVVCYNTILHKLDVCLLWAEHGHNIANMEIFVIKYSNCLSSTGELEVSWGQSVTVTVKVRKSLIVGWFSVLRQSNIQVFTVVW